MADLKPCPFCGTKDSGDVSKLMDLWQTFDDGHIAHVHCSSCGAGGPSEYRETGADAAIAAARTAWNRRAA